MVHGELTVAVKLTGSPGLDGFFDDVSFVLPRIEGDPAAAEDLCQHVLTRAIRGLIRQLRAQGRCVIFSSHVMQEVAALCDRIVVVARGRVVADGTPDELRARTAKDNLEEAFVTVIGSDAGLQG